ESTAFFSYRYLLSDVKASPHNCRIGALRSFHATILSQNLEIHQVFLRFFAFIVTRKSSQTLRGMMRCFPKNIKNPLTKGDCCGSLIEDYRDGLFLEVRYDVLRFCAQRFGGSSGSGRRPRPEKRPGAG
ncbi:MAG: hypothetical protein ACSW8F_01525, partial [bacterium]